MGRLSTLDLQQLIESNALDGSSTRGPGSRSGAPSPQATRREPTSFMSALCLAAALDWLRN
jgi:hypothetical protein